MIKDLMLEDDFIEITASRKLLYSYNIKLMRLTELGTYEEIESVKTSTIAEGVKLLENRLKKHDRDEEMIEKIKALYKSEFPKLKININEVKNNE